MVNKTKGNHSENMNQAYLYFMVYILFFFTLFPFSVSAASEYNYYINATNKHYLSNCATGESGVDGQTAGDQNGNEYKISQWSATLTNGNPWITVFRYPDRSVGLTIAQLGIDAALNDHIGYDWGSPDRESYWNELKEVNYNPSAITTNCEADCASAVCTNVKAAGYLNNIDALKKVKLEGGTSELTSTLTGAGFYALTDSKYLSQKDYLLPGDILLAEGHTLINLTIGSKADWEWIPDNQKPEIVGNLSHSSSFDYTIQIVATDNESLSKIHIGTWNDIIGIDNAKWHTINVYGKSYDGSYTIDLSEFGMQNNTTYHSNVCVDDTSGNRSDYVRAADVYISEFVPNVISSDNLHSTKISWDADPNADWYSIRIYDQNGNIEHWRDNYMKTSYAALLDAGNYVVEIGAVKTGVAVKKSQRVSFSVASNIPSHQLNSIDSRVIGGKLYKLYSTYATWLENKIMVEGLGGRLAIIDSQAKQNCVYEMVHAYNEVVYLGAQGYSNYDWLWTDSSVVEGYTNWDSGKPDNDQGYENCMIMIPSNGLWDDYPNDKTIGCVAEFDPVSLKVEATNSYIWLFDEASVRNSLNVVATFTDGSSCCVNDYGLGFETAGENVTVHVTYGKLTTSYSGRAGAPQPTAIASDNFHMVKIFWEATPDTDVYSIRIYDTDENIVYWRDHYTKNSFAALLDQGSYQVVIAAVKSNIGVLESQRVSFSVTSASMSHQLHAVDSRLLDGKLYKLFNTQTTWLENKKLVENVCGRLAIVDSQAKQECIFEMVHDFGQFVFIGAQGYTNYDWMWVNNSKVEGYTNWEPYRPDNYEGYENCMIMYPNNGHWDDVTNDRTFGCVAEFDLVNLEISPIVYSRISSADSIKGNLKVVATFTDGSNYEIDDYDYTTSADSGVITVDVKYGGITESCTFNESKGYILPNDPTVMGEERFILPDNLTVIKEEAFSNVSGKYFVVPDSVTRIERNAFPANAVVYLNLSKINLPLDAITQMGIYVDNGSTPDADFAAAAEDSLYVVLNIHGNVD